MRFNEEIMLFLYEFVFYCNAYNPKLFRIDQIILYYGINTFLHKLTTSLCIKCQNK